MFYLFLENYINNLSGTDGRPINCKPTSVTGRHTGPVCLQSIGLFACFASLLEERSLCSPLCWNEYAAPAQFAAVQVVDSVESRVERIDGRMKCDLTLSGQCHQFHQIIVRPYQVANEIDLGGDDVDGGHVEIAAIADDIVRPCSSQHGDSILLSSRLTDKVNHRLGPLPVGNIFDAGNVLAVGQDEMICAPTLRQCEGFW